MERPAPQSAAPHLLYVDMRSTSLTAEEVLHALFPVTGKAVVGFQFFAAQKSLGLVFSSAETRAPFVDKTIGDTGLFMYPAPSEPVTLRKLTLQGVPFWNPDGVKAELPKLLASCGEVVFLAPMVTVDGFLSDQWHATLKLSSTSVPPPTTLDLFGQAIIIDIPGERRYCRHCEGTTHVKPSCRQGQRLRRRQAELLRDQQAVEAAAAATDGTSTTDSAVDTAADKSSPRPNPPPTDTSSHHEAWDEEMQESSHSVYLAKCRDAADILARVSEGQTVDPSLVDFARNFLDSAGEAGRGLQ